MISNNYNLVCSLQRQRETMLEELRQLIEDFKFCNEETTKELVELLQDVVIEHTRG